MSFALRRSNEAALATIKAEAAFSAHAASFGGTDLPDGAAVGMVCRVPFAKINLFAIDPNHSYTRCRLVPHEGRLAIVTDAGRDAVDAAALGVRWDRRAGSSEPVSSLRHADEQRYADGEVVWSWHPLLVSSWRRRCRPDRASTTP